MSNVKQSYTIELHEEQMAWLLKMASDYGLEDAAKVIRIAIEYVRDEDELDTVFEEVRCNHCSE